MREINDGLKSLGVRMRTERNESGERERERCTLAEGEVRGEGRG